MNRRTLKELALLRLRDAEVLLEAGQFESAYYISGYVIECALKACLARKTREGDFPSERVNESFTHSLKTLLRLARLEVPLKNASKLDPQLEVNWAIVAAWTEETRYDPPGSRSAGRRAEDIYSAIADRQHGVLAWLKRRW